MVECEVCKVDVPVDEEAQQLHVNGKKHQKALEQQREAELLAKRSVYVKWNKADEDVHEQSIKEAFEQLGKVERVLHRSPLKYAIVEFAEEDSAIRALAMETVECGKTKLKISERKMDLHHNKACLPKKKIDIETLLKDLDTIDGFNSQVTYLVRKIGITPEDTAERLRYVQRLEEELKKYFLAPKLRMFGSSITTIGTLDSDIDACLTLDASSPLMEGLHRSKQVLLTRDPIIFSDGRKIHAEEFSKLSIHDRIRLLSRIINDIRKRLNWVDYQKPIVDARCPLVQVVLEKKYMMDISVDNALGCAKSEYVNDVVQKDKSGNLRKYLLAMRFWCESNGLFDLRLNHEECVSMAKQEKGNFNAYMIDLWLINRFMSLGFIQPFSHHLDKHKVVANGWRIDFYQNDNDRLYDLDIEYAIKQFFSYVIQCDIDNFVFSLRNGAPMVIEQFKEYFGEQIASKFKFGVLNIQDPLEADHNVAGNISHKALNTLREMARRSLHLAKLKKDNFRVMLSAKDAQKDAPLPGSSNEGEEEKLEIEKDSFKTQVIHNLPPSCGAERVAAMIHYLLEVVLNIRKVRSEGDEMAMEMDDEPPSKKFKDEERTTIVLGEYEILGNLWVGRRPLRRQCERENPEMKGKGFDSEIWVSSKILSDAAAVGTVLKNFGRLAVVVVKFDDKAKVIFFNRTCQQSDLTSAIHFLEQLIQNHLDYILTVDAALNLNITR